MLNESTNDSLASHEIIINSFSNILFFLVLYLKSDLNFEHLPENLAEYNHLVVIPSIKTTPHFKVEL